MQPAVAAGHPATTAAGIEILLEGGTAADAAVAAALASCVAETVMTGLLGGGHGIYWDAASGRARGLDCFVAVPGLGRPPQVPELVHLDVPFGEELVHYAIGPASCATPGLPAGLDALWRAHGRLPWPRLVEPALRLAMAGVEVPAAHASCLAMLAPAMAVASRSRPGRAHDQRGGRRRRRECLRRHLEPRSRLGRLCPRPRPAPEQHARRGRPRPRPAGRRRTDVEHDGSVPCDGRRPARARHRR